MSNQLLSRRDVNMVVLMALESVCYRVEGTHSKDTPYGIHHVARECSSDGGRFPCYQLGRLRFRGSYAHQAGQEESQSCARSILVLRERNELLFRAFERVEQCLFSSIVPRDRRCKFRIKLK